MSIIKKIYRLLPQNSVTKYLKLFYYNITIGNMFNIKNGRYKTVLNNIVLFSRDPLYFVVRDISKYEEFYNVGNDDTVIDAGAHHGYLSIYFSKKLNKNGQVFSFEPDGKNIEVMKYNMGLNSGVEERITILNELMWDKEEQIPFNEEGTVASSVHYIPENAKTVLKDTISIDHFVDKYNLTKLDFVKMDIEGAEIEALDGAVKTIERFKPNFAIASYHIVNDEPTYIKVEAFFKKIGYPYVTKFYKDGEIITFGGAAINN